MSFGVPGGVRVRARGLGCVRGDLCSQVFEHVAQFGAHEVARGDVLEGQAQACDLAGEVLGVGQVALGAQTVLLGHDAVAGVMTVLREHNQGGRVRGLG